MAALSLESCQETFGERFPGDDMENWKRAVIAGSVGVAALLLVKRRRPAAVLAGSVGLAVLASEYPEQFVRIREELPSYVRQGTKFLDLAIRLGGKIEELAEKRAVRAFEELGEF
jgi:hypothetical protein